MKIFLLVTLLFLAATMVYSQTDIKKISIKITAGPSFPVGRFGNKNYSNYYGVSHTPSGLAKIGAEANLWCEYRINQSLAGVLLAGGSTNKLDPNGLRKYLEENDTGKVYTYANTHNWQIIKILTGVSVAFPVHNHNAFNLSVTLLAGACKTAKPEYTFGMGNRPGFYNLSFFNQKVSLPWAFAYQAGINADYKLLKNLFLAADVSYFNGYPVYKFDNLNLNGPPTPFEARFALGSLNLNAGVKMIL